MKTQSNFFENKLFTLFNCMYIKEIISHEIFWENLKKTHLESSFLFFCVPFKIIQ